MHATNDTGKIDSHECVLEPLHGESFDSPHDKGVCKHCGTVTSPAQGVKNAKRNRKW